MAKTVVTEQRNRKRNMTWSSTRLRQFWELEEKEDWRKGKGKGNWPEGTQKLPRRTQKQPMPINNF